jgi:thioredoxin
MNLSEFNTNLKSSPRPVIVDLWAPWCGPCRAMEPAIRQMTQKYQNQVDIWKINADEAPEIVKALKVMGIPTTIGFAGGQEVIRKTGMQSIESLDILFDATLHQRTAVILPPALVDRWVRSIIGLVVILLGWSLWDSWLVSGLGAAIVFSAFYDRCPIFQSVAPRVIALFKGKSGAM